MLCCAVLCCAVLCCAVLYCAVLCRAEQKTVLYFYFLSFYCVLLSDYDMHDMYLSLQCNEASLLPFVDINLFFSIYQPQHSLFPSYLSYLFHCFLPFLIPSSFISSFFPFSHSFLTNFFFPFSLPSLNTADIPPG